MRMPSELITTTALVDALSIVGVVCLVVLVVLVVLERRHR